MMSNLIDSSITIYDALQNIKDGKYVMPAFQRQFVWGWNKLRNYGIAFCWITLLLHFCFGMLMTPM
jgi:hypothetical protein